MKIRHLFIFPIVTAIVLLACDGMTITPKILDFGIAKVEDNKLEYPYFSETEHVVEHIGYTVSYNHHTLCPNWVAYELTESEANGEFPRDDNFCQDPDISGNQADLSDYRGSGWDRGHLAPAADMKWSRQAMDECFYLSNMCPQNHAFNAGAWEKTEKMGRRLAKNLGRVYIVTGPIFDKHEHGTIGGNQVQIPDSFFKAFLVEKKGEYHAIAFVMKNSEEKQNLKQSAVTVDSLESIISRDLFHNLPEEIQAKAESRINWHVWGI